jgi:hypothetical protein
LTCLCGFALVITGTQAADFTVTTPGFFFSIGGQSPNPTITLMRGQTYTFALGNSGSHPFFIGTSVGSGTAPSGVSGNNGTSSGTITFAVPTNAANCVYYCTRHLFTGTFAMVDPPAPPMAIITSFMFDSNIVLRSSSGTNAFTIIPEYKANLNDSNWFALTLLSNRFLNGTNETFCGRPPGSNVFIRLRLQ